MHLNMDTVARSQKARERFSLMPRSSITFTVPLKCLYRGIHSVGITTLEINDSLGLVKTTFNMLEMPYYRHIEVKVYPQLTQLGVLPAGEGDSKHIGNAGKWYMDQGESFAGLRPYRPGDPLKRIHRAASSRRRELYVRTYDLPLETSILIALDTIAAYETEEEGLYLADLCCQCAAAIAHYCLKTGYHVIYRDSGLDSALILESMSDFPKLYDRLTELRFEAGDGSLESFPQLAAAQFSDARAAYIISARGNDGIQEALSRYDTARLNVKLIAVHSGAVDSVGVKPGFPATSGVQAISVAVGDDVAAALGV